MSPVDPRHPRSVRTRAAIRAATIDIIATTGAGSVTHQRVAEAAGVGRATVYRHFSTVTDLVADAFLGGGVPPIGVEVTENVKVALRAALDALVEELADPGTLGVITTVLDQARVPGIARQFRDEYVGSLLAQFATLLESAEVPERGTWPLTTEQAFDLLVGPILSQVLLRGELPTPEGLDTVVATALAAMTRLVDP